MGIYAIFDKSNTIENINQLRLEPVFSEDLFSDLLDNQLTDVAPVFFEIAHSLKRREFLKEKAWGKSFSTLLTSKAEILQIVRHLKSIIKVQTENKESFFLRYYDPRVLRIFLPTCDAAQLKEFFGPVEQFICEDEDPAFGLVFSLQNGQLETQRIPVEELFPKNLEVSESGTDPENQPTQPVVQKEKSFTEQPLPLARFSGDPEMLKTYFSSLGSNQLGEYFSSVKSFYSPGENGTNSVFSFSQETQSFVVEEVSDEGLSKIIDKGEQTIKQNQKEYSESILKTKKEDPKSQNPEEDKKPGRWSWLKL